MSTTTLNAPRASTLRVPTWSMRDRAPKKSALGSGITTAADERRRMVEEALRYGRTGNKKDRLAQNAKRVRRGVLAILATILLIVSYGTYESVFGMTGFDWTWGDDAAGNSPPNAKTGYQVAGVHLGMTFEAVKNIHPNMKVEVVEPNEMIATFMHDSVKYTAWFKPVKGYDVLWKVRFSRFLEGVVPDQALTGLANTFGMGYSAACQRSALRMVPDCRYNWLGARGINVQAELYRVQTEPVVGAETAGTSLTLTAFDPQILHLSKRKEQKVRDRALRKEIAAGWKENETWLQAEANRITREAGMTDARPYAAAN